MTMQQKNERDSEIEPLVNDHADENQETSGQVDKTLRKSLWRDITWRQRFLLMDIVFMQFALETCGCTMDPFLSRVVVSRYGGTLLEGAVILQIETAAITIFSFIFGKHVRKFGLKQLFYYGILAASFAEIFFGFLVFTHNSQFFFAMGVTLRIIGGSGVGAYGVAATTIAGAEYPDHIGKVFGLMQAAFGAARCFGPALGGLLFHHFGMLVPLLSVGIIPVLTLPIHCLVLKDYSETSEANPIGALEHLRKPAVMITLTLIVIIYGVLGYTDVAFSLYFKNMNLSTSYVGMAMLAIGGAFALGSTITGYIIGLQPWLPLLAICFGSSGFTVSMFVFTPHQTLPLLFVGSFLLGMTASIAVVPAFAEQINIASGGRADLSDRNDLSLYSTVSGIWYSNMGAGQFMVPIIASCIQETTHASFPFMFYSIAILHAILTVFKTLQIFISWRSKIMCFYDRVFVSY